MSDKDKRTRPDFDLNEVEWLRMKPCPKCLKGFSKKERNTQDKLPPAQRCSKCYFYRLGRSIPLKDLRKLWNRIVSGSRPTFIPIMAVRNRNLSPEHNKIYEFCCSREANIIKLARLYEKRGQRIQQLQGLVQEYVALNKKLSQELSALREWKRQAFLSENWISVWDRPPTK